MRQSFAETLRLNERRTYLSGRLDADDITPSEVREHASLTDVVINGLIDEMKLMSQDVRSTSRSSR
jgi:hypothetical protein